MLLSKVMLTNHQGYIDAVHEALPDLQPFPGGRIDVHGDREQLKERRDLVDAIAPTILFMHPEQQERNLSRKSFIYSCLSYVETQTCLSEQWLILLTRCKCS